MPNQRLIDTLRRRWLVLPAIAIARARRLRLRRQPPAGGRGGASRAARRPRRSCAAPARQGDLPVTLEGHRHRDAARQRDRAEPRRRPAHVGALRGRADGRRPAICSPRSIRARSRCSSSRPQGQLARDQALLANANVDLAALQAARRRGLDSEAAARHPGGAGPAVRRASSSPIRRRSTTRELQLTYARITAPITGRLGLRLVDPGNMVHATDAGGLVVLTQIAPIAVVFTIPEDSLPAGAGQGARRRAQLPVDAYDRANVQRLRERHAAHGRQRRSIPTTGTVRLKARVSQRRRRALPEPVRQRAPAARRPARRDAGADRPPCSAASQGPFVYVVKPDHTAEVRPVTVGENDGDDDRDRPGRHARRAASSSTAPRRCAPAAPSPCARRPTAPRNRRAHESLAPLHRAAGRHHAADGGDPARWSGRPTASSRSRRCRRSTTRRSRSSPSIPAPAPT